MLDSILSIVAWVLDLFGGKKAADGPSIDYTAGQDSGRLQAENQNQARVLDYVEVANAIDRAANDDKLRGTADPKSSDGFRRD
jgi:hypothetical protein